MRFHRTALASATTLVLMTCTSCQTDSLDRDGDGQITQLELLSAVFDFVCGDQTDAEAPDMETPEEPTTDDTDQVEETGGKLGSELGFQ